MRCFKTLNIDVNLMFPPLLELILLIPNVPNHALEWLKETFLFLLKSGENLSPFFQRICIYLFEKKQLSVLNFLAQLFRIGFFWNGDLINHLRRLNGVFPEEKNQFFLCTAAMFGAVNLTFDELVKVYENGFAKPFFIQMIARYLSPISKDSPPLAFR